MKAKKIEDLSKNNVSLVDEKSLIAWGYQCENENSSKSKQILEKIYKRKEMTDDEPTVIILKDDKIVHKIWTEYGMVSRLNGLPADILYDDNGYFDANWYLYGKNINDYIAFMCLKRKKDRWSINESDIAYIIDFFKMK